MNFDWTQYDAVLFDLDGVITPTAEVHERAWASMFNAFLATRTEPDSGLHRRRLLRLHRRKATL